MPVKQKKKLSFAQVVGKAQGPKRARPDDYEMDDPIEETAHTFQKSEIPKPSAPTVNKITSTANAVSTAPTFNLFGRPIKPLRKKDTRIETVKVAVPKKPLKDVDHSTLNVEPKVFGTKRKADTTPSAQPAEKKRRVANKMRQARPPPPPNVFAAAKTAQPSKAKAAQAPPLPDDLLAPRNWAPREHKGINPPVSIREELIRSIPDVGKYQTEHEEEHSQQKSAAVKKTEQPAPHCLRPAPSVEDLRAKAEEDRRAAIEKAIL